MLGSSFFVEVGIMESIYSECFEVRVRPKTEDER